MLRTQDKRLVVSDRVDLVGLRSFGDARLELVGDEANSHGITVTASASANTKGSWAELGTTSFDADGFYVQIAPGTTSNQYLIDIGTGSAGSEVVLVENIFAAAAGTSGGNWPYANGSFYVPLPVPSGTRMAARCQSGTAGSDQVWVSVVPVQSEIAYMMRRSKVTTFGANTGDSGGTTLDPGTVAHTNGTAVELSASITDPIHYAVLCASHQTLGNISTASWFVELCSGAASSETAVMPGMQFRAHSAAGLDAIFPQVHERLAYWPAGARLSARARCSITTATDRTIDVVVIGFS